MRRQTGWLALLILGAWGSVASAQSPLMYGAQPYAPYPYAPAPGAYVPQPPLGPSAYYQPPRVMYVPATPTGWQSAPAPVATAPTHAQPTGQPVFVVAPTQSSPKAPAKAASLRRDLATEPHADCGPEGCDVPAIAHHDEQINWLPKGRWNFQMLGGAYSDLGEANYRWGQSSLRLGHIWDCECMCHVPGAFEGLIEINGGYVTDSDFGNYFTGGGILLRYNCARPCSRVVPYIQAGVGFQYNDAYQDLNQSYLGSRIELTAQGQLGLRIFLTKCCSLDLEGGFQHISDGTMSGRNDGINAMGGMGGVTLILPNGRRH